ncbi:hypothetical protein M5X11_34225 [Paenibacillus alginolyticus]|uniref:hypothetical protein n=1 Tax=Paenibacillus alginolyticus TaxID=59839 RepID=UPI000FDC1993|nr:hypothetical protein [Paenibacillus alginolyticus]MCY9669911.1 hypothetical protein [Paenibacillus alginolyticus]
MPTIDDSQTIEYYQLQQGRDTIRFTDYKCPNCAVRSKRKINRMESFTPMKVAMNVFDNPSKENKQLQQQIDRYVSKLRF